jgi:glutamate dehydrogenase
MDHDDDRDAAALTETLVESFAATAREVVPWFLAQMPDAYFRDTSEELRNGHLRAIIAARASRQPVDMRLKNEDGSIWTLFRERDYPGLLAELLADLPRQDLRSAKVHSAKDGTLILDTFRFGDGPATGDVDDEVAALWTTLRETAATADLGDDSLEALRAHVEGAGLAYLRTVRPERMVQHFRACRAVAGTDDTRVFRRDEALEDGQVRVDVVASRVEPSALLERVCTHLGARQINIRRAYLDVFGRGATAVVGVVVSADPRLESEAGFEVLARELARLRWLEPSALELAYAHAEHLDLVDAEVIVTLAHLAHTVLTRQDRHVFARDRILAVATRHPSLAASIAELLRRRFDPAGPLDDTGLRSARETISAAIEDGTTAGPARTVLRTMLAFVEGALRCNIALPHRYGLALRLRPEAVARGDRDRPYGVYFVHGRGFDAFHVRFRDVARGGVRVVKPRGAEQHTVESRRLFDEVYDLAFAQQLKNKDIPEGGSKAVILVHPSRPPEPCVRAFVDGLLDLLAPREDGLRVDHLGRDELLFLGPDERISAELIEWIVDRAKARGYPLADAFMSSKPGAGINHKEYGVTSEGVTVFLEEALRFRGREPARDPFTVKLTGGPDGDVAGNELRILLTRYPDTARIVGIADGSGAAEDPDGLDRETLLDLVERAAPIAAYDPSRLGPRGRLSTVDAPGGAKHRDTLHERVVADVFVPAGGRPGTVHANNWRAFLGPDGEPTSGIVVEGANLFVTPEAREALSAAGVLIVKDSSANKCGVICSSYEIAASILLAPDELLEVKAQFVEEVLERLRLLARREARLLFREHALHPERSLPELSVELSRTIGRVNDALLAAYPKVAVESADLVERLIQEHLPPTLSARAHARLERMPEAYRAGIVAASLAARLVYREGLAFLAPLADDRLADVALRYLHHEDRCASLAAQVRASELPGRDEIVSLLLAGGARTSLALEEGGRFEDE